MLAFLPYKCISSFPFFQLLLKSLALDAGQQKAQTHVSEAAFSFSFGKKLHSQLIKIILMFNIPIGIRFQYFT
jgi:hypothetical protein